MTESASPPPTNREMRLIIGALAGVVAGVIGFGLSVFISDSYGLVLFLLTPLLIGYFAGMGAKFAGMQSKASAYHAGLLALLILSATLLLFALEGVLCLLMAAPIVVPLTLLGGLCANASFLDHENVKPLFAFIGLLIPGALALEEAVVEYPVLPIVTEIEINAPPQTVWKHVVGFSELPEPTESFFKAGIAYPVRARLEGEGVGAVRYCEFSTGPFVEPITTWEPGKRLAFDVTAQPEPMTELSPYNRVHAPHLLHGLQSRRGEFLLTELPNGGTLLRGTTWYQVNMGPNFYWRLWSDKLIGDIHSRVLRHIKQLAEDETH